MQNNYRVNHQRANDQLLVDLTQNPTFPTAETSFNQNDQDTGQAGARMVQNVPIVRNQSPTAPVSTGSDSCRQGFDNCFCAKDRYFVCQGQRQQPPPYAN